jgi:hypothetical protein
MDMVVVSANRIQVNAFGFGIFGNVCEDFWADAFHQQWLAVLGGPDQVHPDSDVWHVCKYCFCNKLG